MVRETSSSVALEDAIVVGAYLAGARLYDKPGRAVKALDRHRNVDYFSRSKLFPEDFGFRALRK